MQMFSCLKVFVFLGIVLFLAFNTADVNAQMPFLSLIGHLGEDSVYAVGDIVEVVFVAATFDDQSTALVSGAKLIITRSGLTNVTISNGGTTGVSGEVVVRGTIADDPDVYIQAHWPDTGLTSRGELRVIKNVAKHTAQDLNAQVPVFIGPLSEDSVYAVDDIVEVVFAAGTLDDPTTPMSARLTITHSGLTNVTISNGGTTDVSGEVMVRGTIADDTDVYIQAHWPDTGLTNRGELQVIKNVAKHTPQVVFDRYFNTFQHPDVHEHFPEVLRAFKNPEVQNVLNPVVINHFVRDPEYIRAFYPDIDESLITLLTTDNGFRTLFEDEEFHDVLQDPAEIDELVRLIEAQLLLRPEVLTLGTSFTERNPDSGAPQGIITISAYTTAQRTVPEIASIRLSAGAAGNWEVRTSTRAGEREKWSVTLDTTTVPDTIIKDNPGARNAALDNRKYTVRAVAIGADGTEWPSNRTTRFSVDNVDDVPPVGPTNIVSVADADGQPVEANEAGSYTVGGLISPVVFIVQPTAQSATYDSVNLVQTDPDGTETSTEGSLGELEVTVDVGALENGTYTFHALAVDAAGNIQADRIEELKITVHVENHERPRPVPEIVAITFDPANIVAQDPTPTWNLPEGAKARLGKGWIGDIAYSPDGRHLAVASSIDICVYDAETGEVLDLLTGHTRPVLSVSFSPDGRSLASGSLDGTVHLWDVATGVHLRTLEGHTDWVLSVSFSPDGETLASGSADDRVHLWDVATGVHLRTLEGHTYVVWSVSFSPDGRRLASGSGDDTVRLWDVATGVHLRTFRGHNFWVLSVSFSPDGKTLASGSSDRTVRLWDVGTGVHLRTLEGHTDWVESVSFSPDGRRLASGSGDTTVRLWDVETGEHLRTLAGHTDGVSSVSFSPDGKTLASGSSDGMLLWELTPASSTPAPEPVEPVPPSTDEPDQQLPPVVYWIEEGTIFRLDGGNKQTLVEPLEGWTVTSLAMDMEKNKLYWTERQTDKQMGSIWSGDLKDRSVRELRRITAVPEGLVVDARNGRLYWTNNRGKIQSINVDGKNFRGNLITGLGSPHHIALDSATEDVYWTVYDVKDGSWSIWRAPFDGNITKKEIVTGLGQLGGIAVANDKLYWTEGGKISCANKRNGSGVKTLILLRGTVPLGLAVDEVGRRLYWTDNGGNIRSLNLDKPLETEIVVEGLDAPAVAIALGRASDESVPASPAAPSTIAERSVESALLENYPNPFNPETWIPYQLSAAADVSISIYSINGSLVCRLDLGHQVAGVYRSRSRAAYWDGRNEFGERVASGLYFYTLTAGDFTATRKMLIRK